MRGLAWHKQALLPALDFSTLGPMETPSELLWPHKAKKTLTRELNTTGKITEKGKQTMWSYFLPLPHSQTITSSSHLHFSTTAHFTRWSGVTSCISLPGSLMEMQPPALPETS